MLARILFVGMVLSVVVTVIFALALVKAAGDADDYLEVIQKDVV